MIDRQQPDLYYLHDLLHCHDGHRMTASQRGTQRVYRCPSCGRQVDALGVEVEVWERLTRDRPDIGEPATLYSERNAILCRVLRAVELGAEGTAFRLIRRPPAPRSAPPAEQTG